MKPEPSNPAERIGPYRVLERLGAGGMGEVLLAYDERLDRRVAIKRIHPDSGTKPERRERFRREARMAARLSHPAIVQVHDILQENGADYIVMEYVEGTNLHEMTGQGPLKVRQALELARELADGLDAAHRQGIVHRDLKTENVLVTPSGRPKITDFGIAKRLLLEDPEESLTRDHAVLGTCRVMSPEQARGEPVDHRTDLFALGVLLYEVLTGESPFAAENSLATLTRVIHHRQKPLRDLNPAVPEGLSNLVDHLLEKDPLLRPRSAGQVRRELDRLALTTTEATGTETALELPSSAASGVEVAPLQRSKEVRSLPDSALTGNDLRLRRALWLVVLVVLVGLGVWAYRALRPPQPPLYVAVLAPEIGTGAGNEEIELLASGVRVALLQALTSLRGISPKALDEIAAVSGSPVQVAKAVSADEVITSRLDCRAEACRVSLGRLHGGDGSVAWADSVEVPTDDFALVAGAVTRKLRQGYADFSLRDGVPDLDVDSGDLKTFLQLRRRYDSRQDVDLEPIQKQIAELRGRSPRFTEVYLLEAEVARRRFFHSRDPRDLAQAMESLRLARGLAPEDPRPLFALVEAALDEGELDKAEKALRELEDLVPADALLLEKRAHLLKARGRPEEGIALLQEAVRLQPSWKRLYNLAVMEYGEGKISEARGHFESALSRAPGNPTILSKLALLEMIKGDLNRAVQLYEDLVQRAPGLAALSNLGTAYLLSGRYAAASEVYRRVVESEPRNPNFLLNLADSYLLMGRKETASPLYRQIVELAEKDPNPAAFLTVKAQALAHLDDRLGAAAAVQEALRRSPEDAQAAYDAAVVYALLDEPASAITLAKQALDQGFDSVWFKFPWFERLGDQPAFQEILRQALNPASGR